MSEKILLRYSGSQVESLDPDIFSLKGSNQDKKVFTSLTTKAIPPAAGAQASGLKRGLPFFDYHLERLLQNAEAFGLLNPALEEHRGEWIISHIPKAAAQHLANNKPDKDFRVRLLLEHNNLQLYLEPYEAPWSSDRAIAAKCVPAVRMYPEIKSTITGESFLARDIAGKFGCQEAFLIDTDEYLREGAWSNIFWFEADGTLNTPRTKLLPGVTRRVILENCDCIERDILVSHFFDKAVEVCIAQSSTGITPVVKIDSRIVGPGFAGPQVQKLKSLYERLSETHFTPLS